MRPLIAKKTPRLAGPVAMIPIVGLAIVAALLLAAGTRATGACGTNGSLSSSGPTYT